MAECKVVINDTKSGKSYQKVLPDNPYINLKVGDKVNGDELGLTGYELEIRGASDNAGFPIRKDLPGVGRKQITLTKGPGLRLTKAEDGVRIKKTVVSNLINNQIVQVNVAVIKHGSQSVEDALGIKPKEEVKAVA
ncbi:30S ribosomal protein S6e [Candidatus Woesearchaeota archaeon]|nr:30S ribosomal protein S6e [Candidatus Woesearchaeota archaeon]